MALSLPRKYRPATLDQIAGNRSLIESLETILSREEGIPSTFLLHGPSGCGKTTLARIIAKKLGAEDRDIKELNISNTRGIDAARAIIENCRFTPIGSIKKIVVLNECFDKNTPISTLDGQKPIKDISIGDSVFNLEGVSEVTHVFKNKVDLKRVCKIRFNNGKEIYCSKEHEFFTENGWIPAQDLSSRDVIYGKEMPALPNQLQDGKQEAEILFEFLQKQSKKNIIKGELRKLLGNFLCQADGKTNTKILQPKMCGGMEEKLTAVFKRRISEAWKNGYGKKLEKSRFYNEIEKYQFKKNEREKSILRSGEYRKNEKYEKKKWNFACLVRETWWKWTFNETAKNIGFRFAMENGSGGYNMSNRNTLWPEEELFKIKKFAEPLYVGRGRGKFENSGRGGRRHAHVENRYNQRYKKDTNANRIRLESITLYEPGNNDELFAGIISDKERDQGYAELFDLEIKGHPSYFANGIPVHNCHKATNEFQNAMLEILEEPPDRVHFILCTTEPEKLLKTIKTRCSEFCVSTLTMLQSKELLEKVLHSEGLEDFPSKAITDIAKVSEGCPRELLKLLDTVIDIEDDAILIEAIGKHIVNDSTIKELCQALMNKSKWKVITDTLKNITEEPETVRRAVLGYLNAVLLNGGDPKIALLMDCFADNYFNTGKAGLTLSCYYALNA